MKSPAKIPGHPKIIPIKSPNLISPPPTHLPRDTIYWMRKKLPPIIPEKNISHKLVKPLPAKNPKLIFKPKTMAQAGRVTLSKIKYQRRSYMKIIVIMQIISQLRIKTIKSKIATAQAGSRHGGKN